MVMLVGIMVVGTIASSAEEASVITSDVTWNDGDVIDATTISGGTEDAPLVITVNGTVTINGTLRLSSAAISNVKFVAGTEGATLIRAEGFAGQMLYAEGVSGNFHNITFEGITLDGGAVWTGEIDENLGRGTVNTGNKATGSVLYLVYTNVTLENSVLQNHDDSTGEKANAVFLRYYSTITFNNSVVRNNASPSGYYSGGVITVRQGGTAKTYNSEVYGNYGVQGGFFGVSSTGSYGGICEVYDSVFHNNFANEGALFDMQCNSNKGYLLIDGCEFYDNGSNKGLIFEHAYTRPVIIKDSTFRNNECAIWDCHADPTLDLSGKIVIEGDYEGYFFETPLAISAPLAEGSHIEMSEATVNKLMASGYLLTGAAGYQVTEADLAKLTLPEGYELVVADVNGDGIGDTVSVAPDQADSLTPVYITIKDTFDEAAEAQSVVYTNVSCLPVCSFAHEGFTFTGWVDSDGNAVAKQMFSESTTLFATWKIETPVVKLSRVDATLSATVSNNYDSLTYTYQWYMDNEAIAGATASTYTMTDVTSHSYKCEVTATLGEYSASASASGTFSAPAAAQIGDVKYATLKDALAAANALESATITLYKNVTLGEKLTVTGNVTITGAYTITRADDYTGTLFVVNAGATLTLDGGLVIDGNNEWTLNTELYNQALTLQVNNTTWAELITSEEGKPCATAPMFLVNGSVVANNVTIQNNYSNKSSNNGDYGVFQVQANATLTMNGATVKHIVTGGACSVAHLSTNSLWTINDGTLITDTFAGKNGGICRNDSGKLVMNGGEISNNNSINTNGTVVMLYGGTMEMNGGKICANTGVSGSNNGRCAPIYGHSNSTFVMTGGEICHNIGISRSGVDVPSSIKVEISGGYIGENATAYANANADLTGNANTVITGGTFTQDVSAWLAEGLMLVLLEDGTYGVAEDPAYGMVAQVGDQYFATLQEAIDACKNGETIKVLVDLVFGADDVVYAHGGATGFGDYDQYNPTIFYVGGTKGVNGAANQPSDVNVVIDLNGHSLTNTVDTYFFMFMDNCKVTFKDSVGGGMLYAKAEAPVIWVVGTETLVTIESGYYLTDSATGVLHCTHGGDLVIEGGEFETTASDASLLLMLNTKDRQNSKFFIQGVATITIKGGNFHGFNPAKVGDDNGATSLADIKFVNGCAEGYAPVADSNGNYVVKVPAITVDGMGYDSLADAVKAANKLGTAVIELHQNLTLGEKLTISGNVTITGAYTITRANEYTGTFFVVNAGATLTLDGGLVIDGGNNYAFDKEAYMEDAKNRTQISSADSTKWFTPVEGAPVASAFMITTTGGTVNLNNVTIQNNYSTGSGIVSAGANSTINFNGAVITHNAVTANSGLAANVSGANIFVNVNEGTKIDGNHVGGNHGIFKVYSGATLTMNGGEITNNTGWNSNGVVIGIYWASVYMKGGLICSNTGVYGPSNGRNAAIYGHSGHTFVMTGGTICHNAGGYGGLDAPYDNGTTEIHGGAIVDNVSNSNNNYPDVNASNKLVITGGTFTQDVSKWLAPGLTLVFNEETGKYEPLSDLYEYNGNNYSSFEAVIADIKANNDANAVVKVLGSHKISSTIVIDVDLTLDLNGKTITTATSTDSVDAFTIYANVTVTGAGKVDARPSLGYTFYIGDKSGKVGNLTIMSGTFYGDTTVAQATTGTLTIYGGNFAVNPYEGSYDYALNCWDTNYKNGTAKITVYGGVFYKFNPANNAAEGANTSFVADGYLVDVSGDYYTARVAVYVAEVNGVKYESVQAAVDAAKNGDTVKVLLRHAVSDSIVIDKDIILDLSAEGARIDAAADLENKPVVRVLATVTIKGNAGIIDGYKGINSYAIIVGNSTTAGTLYISEGMFRGVTTAISVTNGTAYISGGTFYTRHDGEGTDYGATYMLNCLDSAYNNGTAKIIVTGGLFDGFNPYNNAAEGVNTNFCPENYRTNLNGTWYSVTYAVAERNGIYYPSIREAATGDGIVTVLIDHEVDLNNNFYGCPIVANGKEIVIDLNGKTIVADWSKYTYNSGEMGLFVVANGGKLTITGNGTVINKDSGNVNIEAHIFHNMNGSAARHNYIIIENGTFYQYDSTQIIYSQGHAASNNVLDQHTYIKGGTFISLCADETMKNDFFNAIDWYKQYTEITGGTFSMNPSDWELTIPEGYCVAKNSDGLYTVQKEEFTSVYTAPTFDADGFTVYTCKFCAREYTVVDENSKLVCVAEYNGVKYESFWDALAASKAGDKSAVTVYQTVVITEDGTVDLGGVRVNAGKGLENAPVFRILANVTFIGGIVDARGPVAGEGGVNAYAFIVGNSETAGTLTITAGTYRGVTSAISITNGTVNISGGTFQTGHDNEGTDYGTTYLLNCLDSAYKNGTAKFNITGGKFVGFNPENNAAEGAGTNFLSGNYKASDYYGDNKWYVAEANVVLDGDKYFATIKDALATLTSADTTVHTVKVLRDLEIDVNNSTYNYPILVNGFAIELDLNGKTLTADWSKYTGTRADNALIGVCNGGKLTIIDSVGGGKIVNNDDKPNVENRIFWIMTSTANKSIEVVIKGGTFVQNDKNTALLYIQGNKPSDNLAPIYVSIVGGHFETVNEDFFNAYDGFQYSATISGGTFNKNPTDSEIKPAEGFCVVPNADGTYGVETLEFKGARLLLKDGIGIYFMLNTEDLKRNDYVAVFTYVDENGETVKVEVEYKDWKHFKDHSNSGILFDGIVAKSIATEVSVVIMVDGKVVSETQKMSVKAYAQAIINGDKYTAEAKALAEALLNYGALAENSFASSENKSDMTNVNKVVNEDFKQLGDSSKVSNSVYYGSSVNLESYLGFNFKFRAEAVAGATKAVITYGTNNAVNASITLNEEGSLAIVTLNGLKVSDADLALTCTLYDDNGNVIATATDSVYNYCARALKGLGNMSSEILAQQNFQPEFYKALVLYIEAANKYTEVIGYDAE